MQGGSVVDSLLRQGTAVRALTRNPKSSKAKALAKRGVEVVQGDLADKASLVEVHSAHPPSPYPPPRTPQCAPSMGGPSPDAPACRRCFIFLAALQCYGRPLGLDAGYEAGSCRFLCH